MESAQQATLRIVHRHFTPFALALVAAALLIARPPGVYAAVSFGVLAFAALFNWFTERWAHRPGMVTRVKEARLGVNLAINCFLVYILLPVWRPIWLLFVLTPVATGVYEGRSKTLQMGAALSALLIWAYWVNGLRSPGQLSEAGVHAAFIVFLSHFVHSIAHAASTGPHPGAPRA